MIENSIVRCDGKGARQSNNKLNEYSVSEALFVMHGCITMGCD